MPTQLPRVPSLIPSSFATLAIGRDVSITIFTASSLNSGEKLFLGRGNYFTFPDGPSYWMDCPEGSGHLMVLIALLSWYLPGRLGVAFFGGEWLEGPAWPRLVSGSQRFAPHWRDGVCVVVWDCCGNAGTCAQLSPWRGGGGGRDTRWFAGAVPVMGGLSRCGRRRGPDSGEGSRRACRRGERSVECGSWSAST